ncbi:MAG: hypothetical protein K2N72_11505 [Oscillospiraceae bacterium]|nr:hypothetical protein [Oscillospiraceae bacterium]
MGGDLQQKIADISEIIFKMDGDRLCDRVSDEIALGAARLEVIRIPAVSGKLPGKTSGKITQARLLEKIKKAELLAEEVMNSLAHYQTELYKAEAVYICLEEELGKCRGGLMQIRQKYNGSSGSLTARRMSDLEMSEMVAQRYIYMTKDRRQAVHTLCEGIGSLRGNTYPLWKGAVMGAVEGTVTENFGRAEYLRRAIIEEMKKYAAAYKNGLFYEKAYK